MEKLEEKIRNVGKSLEVLEWKRKELEKRRDSFYKQSEENFKQTVQTYVEGLIKRELKLETEKDDGGQIECIFGPIFQYTKGDGGDDDGRGERDRLKGVYCEMTPKGSRLNYFETEWFSDMLGFCNALEESKILEKRSLYGKNSSKNLNFDNFYRLLTDNKYSLASEKKAFEESKKEIAENLKKMQKGKASSNKYLVWFKKYKKDPIILDEEKVAYETLSSIGEKRTEIERALKEVKEKHEEIQKEYGQAEEVYKQAKELASKEKVVKL